MTSTETRYEIVDAKGIIRSSRVARDSELERLSRVFARQRIAHKIRRVVRVRDESRQLGWREVSSETLQTVAS